MRRELKRLILMAMFLSLWLIPYAGAEDVAGKFRVVPGTGDNAYLVDTQTGAVWVLTQRTLASGTGREPVAIPYKFLYIRPDETYYLDEEGRKVPVGGSRRQR